MLTIAIAKGRILTEALPLLARMGLGLTQDPQSTRALILPTQRRDLRALIVRASDVPVYVAGGGADLGITGSDVLRELGEDFPLYEPVDLQLALCRLSVAAPVGFDYAAAARPGARLRVATKYLRLASEHFARRGVHMDGVSLYGSMELAPLTGLSQIIVDLVASGDTLRANHLAELETIMPISARLVVNPAQLKRHMSDLRTLIHAFAAAVPPAAPSPNA